MIKTKTKRKSGSDLTVIKKDIKEIKKRLDNTATKDDLKRFATKDDLKQFLTKTDYYNSVDKIIGELKDMREENMILSDMKRQVNDVEDRLETVEGKLGIAF